MSFQEALRVWVKVALYSFGGPAGQIAVMHRLVVEERGWVSEARFLHALNYCMLLPGPEAQQLATYLGWLLHGTRGGLVAGGLFVIPGFVSILVLSVLYASLQDFVVVDGLFFGLKAAVLAVVVEAVLRIGRRVLQSGGRLALAVSSFVAIFCFDIPFPLIVLVAGALGLLGEHLWPTPPSTSTSAVEGEGEGEGVRPSGWLALRTAGLWLALWLLPVAGLVVVLGPDHTLARLATFFSMAAMVTFGGAYSVLAYVAQQAVEVYGWLAPGEMLDGLGMAETTPGPLIQVVQFVGFLAAWRDPGGLSPLAAGVVGSVITTWVTFVPCFLWVFTGAPYMEWLRGNRPISAALSAITAAVVGVILHLAVWFSLHVAFAQVNGWDGPAGLHLLVPVWSSVDLASVAISLGAGLALLHFRLGMMRTLLSAATVGVLWRLLAA